MVYSAELRNDSFLFRSNCKQNINTHANRHAEQIASTKTHTSMNMSKYKPDIKKVSTDIHVYMTRNTSMGEN